jgi:hypothetical protein
MSWLANRLLCGGALGLVPHSAFEVHDDAAIERQGFVGVVWSTDRATEFP